MQKPEEVNMLYTSTRDTTKKISGASAIVSGISEEGGLIVPQSIPKLSGSDIKKLLEMDYCERAAYIMNLTAPKKRTRNSGRMPLL